MQHLVDVAEILRDADVGCINHPASFGRRVDGGLALALAEHIELHRRANLDVGDGVIRHEDVAHRLGQADEHPCSLAEIERFRGAGSGRLGSCRSRGADGAERNRQGRHCSAEARPAGDYLSLHLSELPPEQR